MPQRVPSRPAAAALLGCAAFVLIGWTGLLVPSLIRSVKDAFGQSDAGIGLWYLLFASTYAAGSLSGGLVIERLGRRTVLALGTGLLGGGLLTIGLAPSWTFFLLGALPMGFGNGVVDGGVNGLFLDLYRTGRGRALNLLHVFFSLGAFGAPVVVGRLVESGVGWQAVLVGTAVAAIPVAVLFGATEMPAGRHGRSEPEPEPAPEPAPEPEREPAPATLARGPLPAARRSMPGPLLLLGLAIGCFVAAEGGVSNWLVRFLEQAPLSTATFALGLFWGGITVGRLVSAPLADRFDHLRYTLACAAVLVLTLVGAILVPSLPASIALFGLAGLASGPIYPMIVAFGGERYPDRTAAVGGFLSGAAVAGSIVYPPVMGFLSVTVGLTIAMLGNVALAIACAGALAQVGRWRAGRSAEAAMEPVRS